MALPAIVGPLIAGAAPSVIAGAVGRFGPKQQEGVNYGGAEGDGFGHGNGMMGNLAFLGAGAAGGVALGDKAGPDASPAARMMNTAKNGALGAVSGFALDGFNDAMQRKGGGIAASLYGGLSGAATSLLQKDGPNLLQSTIQGMGAGMGANFVHDKFTEAGMGKIADVAGTAGMGAVMGNTITGDGLVSKSSGLGALAGAGVGGISALSTHRAGAGLDMPGAGEARQQVVAQQQESAATRATADDLYAAQSSGGSMATSMPSTQQSASMPTMQHQQSAGYGSEGYGA